MRQRKQKVKSDVERQREWRQRRELGLHAHCRVTRYSVGTARNITPEIRGKMICSGAGLGAFLKECGTNQFIGKERKNPHLFMSQLRRMPPEKAFDRSSTVKPGDKAPSREGSTYRQATPQWRWPHRNIKRQLIVVGDIPTKEECRQRWIRLGWKRPPGWKFRDSYHKSKWRKRPRKERHRLYWIDAMQDVCQMLTRRSGRFLSDESRDVRITNGPIDYEKMREARDENIGVFTELFSQVGMRPHASFGLAHYQPGESGPVSQKEIAKFEQTASRLQAELRERAPPLKPMKKYRASPLPLRLAA